MRQILDQQLPVTDPQIDHQHARELGEISRLLDENPTIYEIVWQDLLGEKESQSGDSQPQPTPASQGGSQGMSAEQVLRAFVLMRILDCTYRELEFHLKDSSTYRNFCRLGWKDTGPSKSTLQANFKRLKPPALEKVHHVFVRWAQAAGIESGEAVRIDCTPVEANVHKPRDSEQAWDGVRKLTQLMQEARKILGGKLIQFIDRRRRTKKLRRKITLTRKTEERKESYRKLLGTAREVCRMAQGVREVLLASMPGLPSELAQRVKKLAEQLAHYEDLTERVIDQARRRVVKGESVPSDEKVLSLFEDHISALRAGGKTETYYGHKVCLSAGKSTLILDCKILDGNPADSTLAVDMVDRQIEIYDRAPEDVAFDGSFASRSNLQEIKARGVTNVVFSKSRGLQVSEMAKSSWVYQRLWRFRAGVESCISFLKRAFGLARCCWRSLESFRSYVWGSILSCNLLVLARHRLA